MNRNGFETISKTNHRIMPCVYTDKRRARGDKKAI